MEKAKNIFPEDLPVGTYGFFPRADLFHFRHGQYDKLFMKSAVIMLPITLQLAMPLKSMNSPKWRRHGGLLWPVFLSCSIISYPPY